MGHDAHAVLQCFENLGILLISHNLTILDLITFFFLFFYINYILTAIHLLLSVWRKQKDTSGEKMILDFHVGWLRFGNF